MTKHINILLLSSVYLLSGSVYADIQPNTDREKFSYSVGVQLAQNMSRQSIQVDIEAFVQAIRDVLGQSNLKLSVEEMTEVLVTYQQQEIKRQQQLAEASLQAGRKFLAENKKKEGIVELPSGLQYKVIKQGGGEKPTSSDTIIVHYRGTLLDGTEFDSSYRRGEPTTLKLGNVIKGWQEALLLMPTGSEWQIYVPSQLAYGEQTASPVIGPNSTLIFDIELISIN